MSFAVSPRINYQDYEKKRCIFDGYRCNCQKEWKGKDKFILVECSGLRENIIFEESCNFEQNISDVVKFIGDKITKKCLVAGGHTVVNLQDRFKVSSEAINSVKMALALIDRLRIGREMDFLIPLNDFYMEKDAGTDEGKANSYRKEAYNPYIVPPEILKVVQLYEKRWNTTTNIYYCSEKNMADKFKRHIKSSKKENKELFYPLNENRDWYMSIDGHEFPVITNNKPNCAAGNAATLRDIRYEVSCNKVKDKYTSHIGIYPLCSMKNVLDGYLAGEAFYHLSLPTYFIFTGKSCFR
ncbi:hypothetical protein [uncultured Veillonella sp.]|uniref:hypothetical protein n=1 Tax=uncultured Veillonella sp. TaxID=159268 RepID=UPI0025979D92|nr:hypothetical protein [uncultured Veillonella sp.]